jgi:phage/plasmid-associated DNA primase
MDHHASTAAAPTLSAFLDALYGPGSDPWTLTGPQDRSRLVRLREYAERPNLLGEYWVPGFAFQDWMAAQREQPTINAEALENNWNHGNFALARSAAFCTESPDILVIEQDRLLMPTNQNNECTAMARDGITDDELKVLQTEAIWHAARMSGMPFTAAVHSGSKSIHFYIKMADPENWPQRPPQMPGTKGLPPVLVEQARSRQSRKAAGDREGVYRRWYALQQALYLALGPFDIGVLDGAGQGTYVRTPGAVRSNGQPQRLLAVNRPVTFAEFWTWLLAQLSPQTREWFLNQHRPLQPLRKDPQVRSLFRCDVPGGWKDMVVRRVAQGHSNGMEDQAITKQWLGIVAELYPTQRQPVMHRRPNIEQGDWGHWDASFLWWVSAYAVNRLSQPLVAQHREAPAPYGWFFTGNDWWWTDGKGKPTNLREMWKPGNEGDLSVRLDQAERDAIILHWMDCLPELNEQMQAWKATGYDKRSAPRFGIGTKIPVSTEDVRPTAAAQSASRIESFLHHLGGKCLYASEHAVPYPKRWMSFNGKIWVHKSEEAVEKAAYQAYEDHPLLTSKGELRQQKAADRKELMREAYVSHAYGNLLWDREWQQNRKAVVFDNGTAYVTSDSVEFHAGHWNPDDMATMALPYAFDSACPTPLFDHFMATSFAPEEAEVVLQFMGSVFDISNPYKKFLLAKGAGDSGKTTLQQIFINLIGGHKHVLTPSLTGMLQDRYWASQLPNARLIAIDEQTDTPINMGKGAAGLFKLLTGDGTVEVRQMRENPFNMQVCAKLLVCTNNLPTFSDDSSAFWGRVLLVQPRKPAQKIADLADKIISSELPGVAAKVLAALMRLKRVGAYHITPEMQAAVDSFREMNSPLVEFWNEWMVRAEHEYCYLPALSEVYKRVRDSAGFRSMSRFMDSLRTTFPGLKISRLTRENMGQQKIHHLPPPAHCPNSFYAVSGWRCLHPSADTIIAPPSVDLALRGTAEDTTMLPPPRRDNTISMRYGA